MLVLKTVFSGAALPRAGADRKPYFFTVYFMLMPPL